MKILIYSDVHWNTSASLVKQMGKKYSVRLEHLIDSINWAHQLAKSYDCRNIICAGDFFDRPTLTDQEVSALKEIDWQSTPAIYLVGNHESSVRTLEMSTTKVLEDVNNIVISKSNTSIADLENSTQIHFLPYITETEREPLINYLNKDTAYKKHVIISHNEIAGINYGGFESKTGFSIQEIEANCDLFLNGHLHNSEWISKKILNVGSISAHNFTNDSTRYQYGIWILDTADLSMTFMENPYGFNFYKADILAESDLSALYNFKANSVCSIRCAKNLLDRVKTITENETHILVSRVVPMLLETKTGDSTELNITDLHTDYLAELVTFCKQNIANVDILDFELAEICK